MRNDESKQDNLKELLRELLAGLLDFDFRTIVTTRMVPTIYMLGIVLSLIFTLHSVVRAFQSSLTLGFAWLALFGPAFLIATVVTLRIALEVILVLFRLAVTVEQMDPVLHKIAGQTDEIVTDLPRIQFWKVRKRPTDRDDEKD